MYTVMYFLKIQYKKINKKKVFNNLKEYGIGEEVNTLFKKA